MSTLLIVILFALFFLVGGTRRWIFAAAFWNFWFLAPAVVATILVFPFMSSLIGRERMFAGPLGEALSVFLSIGIGNAVGHTVRDWADKTFRSPGGGNAR